MLAFDLDAVRDIAALDHHLAVVSTTRRDGSVHSSVVNAGVLAHPVTGELCVGFVVRGDARKLAHLRRSRRGAVVFRAGWRWGGVEGPVGLAGPEDRLPGFGPERLPRLLRDIFSAAGGTHEDWAEYDRVMVAERRAAVLVEPMRITGSG